METQKRRQTNKGKLKAMMSCFLMGRQALEPKPFKPKRCAFWRVKYGSLGTVTGLRLARQEHAVSSKCVCVCVCACWTDCSRCFLKRRMEGEHGETPGEFSRGTSGGVTQPREKRG